MLDFDGPMVRLFANISAAAVAARVAEVAALELSCPRSVLESPDPLEVLRLSRGLGAPLGGMRRIDDALVREEVAAVVDAPVTPGLRSLLAELKGRGIGVAVASNNSERCILTFLAREGLEADCVVGRRSGRPDLMKPDPWCLHECARRLAPAEPMGFVGDSVADMAAARSAGIPGIGFANRRGKASSLADSGARFVVHDLGDVPNLVAALCSPRPIGARWEPGSAWLCNHR